MKKVRFITPAEEEMNLAAAFYEERVKSLGLELLKEIRNTSIGIAVNPELAPKVSGEIRRRLVRRFPFALLYRIEIDEILVLAVMHLSRNPDYWKER